MGNPSKCWNTVMHVSGVGEEGGGGDRRTGGMEQGRSGGTGGRGEEGKDKGGEGKEGGERKCDPVAISSCSCYPSPFQCVQKPRSFVSATVIPKVQEP